MHLVVNEQTALSAAFDSSGRRPSNWSPHFAGSQMGSWRQTKEIVEPYIIDVAEQS